jgi:hypothetical protein
MSTAKGPVAKESQHVGAGRDDRLEELQNHATPPSQGRPLDLGRRIPRVQTTKQATWP